MKVIQNRTYVLQEVTEQELDDLWTALRISIADYRTKAKDGSIGAGGLERLNRMEKLADHLYDATVDGEF